MAGLKSFMGSTHIQIAIAAGISILAFATATVWLPMRPFDPLLLTIPALIEVVHGVLYKKRRDAPYMKTWYWVCAIFVSTTLLILSRKF